MGLVSDFGMHGFVSWYYVSVFLLCVHLDLASVSSSCTYVNVWCGFIVEPGGHAGLEGIGVMDGVLLYIYSRALL